MTTPSASAARGEIQPGSPEERKGLAIAALVISFAAVFCAFIPGWKLFSAICSVVSIGISIYCISKTRKPGGRARIALWALGLAILAILIIGYSLLTSRTDGDREEEIREVEQVIRPAEIEDALNKLNSATDSAAANEPSNH